MKNLQQLARNRFVLMGQVVLGLALVSLALDDLGFAGRLAAIGALMAGHAFGLLAPTAASVPAPAPTASPVQPTPHAANKRPTRQGRRPHQLTR